PSSPCPDLPRPAHHLPLPAVAEARGRHEAGQEDPRRPAALRGAGSDREGLPPRGSRSGTAAVRLRRDHGGVSTRRSEERRVGKAGATGGVGGNWREREQVTSETE